MVEGNFQPIRNTTQIWVVIRHQNGISELAPHMLFRRKIVGSCFLTTLWCINVHKKKNACVEGTSRYHNLLRHRLLRPLFLSRFLCAFSLPGRHDHLNWLRFRVFKQRFYSYKLDDVDLLCNHYTLKIIVASACNDYGYHE